MRSGVLVATDLDRTLIYSHDALAVSGPRLPALVCVEHRDEREASFMTERAAALYADLTATATVVPVTTRIPTQLDRVQMPGADQRYAIAANGGFLFVDGRLDEAWTTRVLARLRHVASLDLVLSHLDRVCDPAWTTRVRNADGMFCYCVVNRAELPAEFVDELTDWASQHGWTTSLQGNKLYCVPTLLTKSAAVAEVAARVDADLLLAAGDSLLDIDLLLSADRSICPDHGELAETGWLGPGVERTTASGVLAGEEIMDWFTEQQLVHAESAA